MNNQELDRLICERLDIKGEERWSVGNDKLTFFSNTEDHCKNWVACNPNFCSARGFSVRKKVVYPALSTTGDGMVILMEALKKSRLPWSVWNPLRGRLHYSAGVSHSEIAEAYSAPLALALAAATALGIMTPR
jgi:hypothetical protein